MFIVPMSPRASTSSMYLVMTYLWVRTELLGKVKRIHIDAKRHETRDLQFLKVNNLAFIRRRFAFSRDSRLLKGIGSRGFRALVAQKSWGRYSSHRIFGLGTISL